MSRHPDPASRRSGALVASPADCTAILHRDGRIREVDPAIADLFGYQPAELVGRSWLDLLHPDDMTTTRQLGERGAAEPGFMAAFEIRSRARDGSYRRLAVLGWNCLDDPQVAGFLLHCRDITATVPAEEAARALLDIQRELLGTRDPDKLRDKLVSAVLWLFRAKRAILYHVNADSGGLVCVATAGEADPVKWIGKELPPGAAAGGRAVVSGAAQRTPDLTAESSWPLTEWLAERLRQEGCPAAAAAPLIAAGETLGAIVVHDVPGRQFTDEEIGFLSAFADQAALASHNARLFRSAEQRAERLSALHALTALISSAADRREMIEAVARAATVLLGARLTRVLLADPRRQVLRVEGSFGLAPEAVEAAADYLEIPYGQCLAGVVCEAREPLCVTDIQDDPRVLNQPLARECGLRGYAGFPLVAGGGTVGVLCILFGEPRRLTAEDRELLGLLADHAAIALRRAQAEEETRRRQQAAEALAEVGRLVSESLDPEVVSQRIVDSLRALLSANVTALLNSDAATGEITLVAASADALPAGQKVTRRSAGAGLVGLAFRERRAVASEDVLADPRFVYPPQVCAWIERMGYRTALAAPLLSRGQVIGGLVAARRAGASFGEGDLALAQAFAYQAEIALGNSELYAELRRAFDRSEESEQRFRQLVEGIDAIVWEADATGRLTFISRGADGIAGPDVEQVSTLRELCERLAHPEDRQRALAFLEIAAAEGTNGVTEHRVLSTDGRVLHVLHRVRVAKDAEGRVRQLRGLVVDITGEKKVEERQRLQATVTRILAEAPAVRGAIQEVLRAVCSLLGWDLGEMWLLDREAGLMRWEDMWSATTVDGDAFGEASAGMAFPIGVGLPGRTWARNAPLWVPDVRADPDFVRAPLAAAQGFHAAFTFPIRASGEVTGVMLFLSRDVRPADPMLLEVVADLGEHIGQFAERRRVEEALARSQEMLRQAQKMEGLGRLAGGVAHDFNNLLTVIIGRSEFLQSALEESNPLRRNADIVHDTAERAAAITKQLLAFSRQQTLEPRVLDLNGIVTGIEGILRRLIREDIELIVQRAPGLWSVRADPTQLDQVIMNLAVNARDAMPEGGTLSIRTANVEAAETMAALRPGARPGPHVLLEVSDTGAGMSREVQGRIFEPFFTTKEIGRGTGLGLATVYGIVQQHEGWIEVRSQPGHGTTFAVYLPRVEGAADAVAARPAHRERLTGSETILLAEDEAEVRRVVLETLESLGYRVIEAPGPMEALAVAERHGEPIHLLLTDVVMPRMRGPELARQVARLRPEIKVLYISGHADDAVFRSGVLPEGVVLLAKPFDPESLARKVREVLDRAR
ncbi:MAG: GAF domain-containing protein [candidate division NC10 bacterium]